MNRSNPTTMASRIGSFFLVPTVGQPTRATLAIRVGVGSVFLVSGMIKLLFENQGAARFAKLGLPGAAGLVAAIEIVAGAMLLAGLFVRLATLPLMIDMLVAIVVTKVPLFFGAGPEPVAAMPKSGLWAFAYQARLDGTMLIALVHLAVVGAGVWSLDAILSARRTARRSVEEYAPQREPIHD